MRRIDAHLPASVEDRKPLLCRCCAETLAPLARDSALLEIRPLYHHRDDTSIGHIVACLLTLRLEVDLQRRLDARGVDVSWPDLMRDVGQVQANVMLDGQRYRLRTDLTGSAHIFAAAGVGPPAPHRAGGRGPQCRR